MRKSYLYIWGLVALLLVVGKVGQAQDSLGMSCLSSLDYWQGADDIQMVGDMAYVVSANTLHIVSLADPAHPLDIGQVSWSDSWSGSSVCLRGDLAYVASGFGVIVFDVSDPAHPNTLVEWIPWAGCEVEFFLVLGDIAILSIIDGGRYVVDISSLGNIHIVGGNLPSSLCCPIGMVGEYVCFGGWGLSMWDFSDPTLPVQVAEVDTQFVIGATAISGNHAYAGTFWNGLRIIDVSNPLQPVEVGSCDSGTCEAVTVTGDHAIVLKGDGLNIWNVSDPGQPVFESSFGPHIVHRNSLASSGTIVCAGDMDVHSPSLLVVDITDPHAPTEISTIGTKGFLYRMAVSSTVGYLANAWSDLLTIDLSDLTEVVELGMSNEESSFGSFDVAIRGSYAYMACGSGGLMVFDVGNPAQPESIAAIDQNTDFIGRITIAGDYAYVIDGYSGSPFWLRTFSLADPAAPVCVNTLHITNYASGFFGFAAANGYLYLGRGWGFYTYSLADPAAPQLVGSCDLPHALEFHVEDLALLDNYSYVAYAYGGVRIIDVSDPTHPTEVGSVGEPTWAVATSGNTLMTFGLDGISVKDVTDRLNPVTIGYYHFDTTNEWIRDMDVMGQYLLTAGGGKFRVYLCDALSGIESRPELSPYEFALLPPYPNPFNSTLIIPFDIPIQSEAVIIIYNILGQKVQEFALPHLSPGLHRVTWDASSHASGIYLVRMATNGQQYQQKVVLLR